MDTAPNSIIGFVILILTAAASYQGLRHARYMKRYDFYTDGILIDKQYDRLLSSGFLHAGWIHLGFNMAALMAFSWSLELTLGIPKFLLLYISSMLGGSLLSLFIHRQHGDYRAVGASGAISGIVAASIVLYPDIQVGLIFLPGYIDGWLFGLLFVLISIIGMKVQNDNIGHDAHLGGALVGALIAGIMEPQALKETWWMLLLMLAPAAVFLVLIARNPAILLIDGYWGEAPGIRRLPTRKQPSEKDELNRLLAKIKDRGMASLTPKERKTLDELSKKQ